MEDKKMKESELCKEVLEHLNSDAETWLRLSKKARGEAESDMLLMYKIRKKLEEMS